MSPFYDAIKTTIPRIRRYGWLLTGSLHVADDYAQACLERLLLDHRPVETIDFFRIFHSTISDAEIVLDTGRNAPASRLGRELLALPVDQRAAVLLVHLEGFSRDQAAHITGLTPGRFLRRLEAARATLKRRIAAAVFIIEDEAEAARQMWRLIEAFGHVVCGTAPLGRGARARIEAASPTLIVADMPLGDLCEGSVGDCEDVCIGYDAPVIYLTPNAPRVRDYVRRDNVFVVGKPFEPELLRTTMGLALALIH